MKSNLSKDDSSRIVDAIRAAEKTTSGEIRVHVENRCWGDPLKRAGKVFKKLKMHQTRQHNGILIYLALKTHRFAILGDRGINEQVDPDFWENVLSEMRPLLQKDQLCESICTGVARVGETLRKYFPHEADDKNELSDEISLG